MDATIGQVEGPDVRQVIGVLEAAADDVTLQTIREEDPLSSILNIAGFMKLIEAVLIGDKEKKNKTILDLLLTTLKAAIFSEL